MTLKNYDYMTLTGLDIFIEFLDIPRGRVHNASQLSNLGNRKEVLMRAVTLKALVITLGLLLLSLSLFGQANGRILGTVTDQTGAVIGGARLSIIDT